MKFLLSIALLLLTSCASIFSMEITNLPPQSSSSISQDQFEQALLNRHKFIDAQDKEGKTLLMHAVEQNKSEETKIYLENHANPWIPDNNKECSFHAVCKTENLTIARQLLKKHGDENKKKDKEGWKWLYTPGSKFSPHSQQMKNQGINVLFTNYPRAHNNPLFKQLLLGNIKKIDKIFDKNPEAINQMVPTDHCALDTPITWAVHLNDEKLVDHLLKKGAKIEIPVTGLNAYDWAVTSPTIRALMMPHGGEFLQKQDYFFYNAIGKNDLKMVKSFLDKTPTLLGLSRQGYTPLAWAKRWEKKDVATYLENRLAFVQQELAGAARYGDIALIDKSLDGGAKINGFDSKGLAPLHWACIQGNSETIASLIDKNADLNIVDRNKGRTGLRWLLRMHTGSVKKDGRQITTEMLLPGFFLLASAGADPNVPDIYGQSVVDWIPYQGFNETEKTLVNKALKAKDLTNSERKLLLENIHSFQKNKCMADSDTRKLSVKKHRTRSNSFKDIYKKYIEL